MLYAFGSNGTGQLGLRNDKQDHSEPQPLEHLHDYTSAHVEHLTAGGNHSLFHFSDGTLRAVGNNEDGRCLYHPESNQDDNQLAMSMTGEVLGASASWSATFVVKGQGSGGVWSCGSGQSGQLGLGKEIVMSNVLQRISHFPPEGTEVLKLTSCMAHTVAVLSNGDVFGWGNGRKGQLGEPAENVWRPRKIDGIPFRVLKAACGKDFTCLIGSREKGEIMVLGPRGNDRFGIRSNALEAVPMWRDIAASWGSVYVLKESGELVAWGRDDHGQLPPAGLPFLKAVAAGSEHCLALSNAGKVLAWGWGEHGNCGEHIDPDGDVKGQWNEIETPGKVTAVFAGCATSFIVATG